MHAAAAFGSVDVIKLFTHVKVDLNTTTADAVTPLMLAASAGHQRTLRLLLKGGANVSMSDKAGLQALHYASGDSASPVSLPRATCSHYSQLPATKISFSILSKQGLMSIRCTLGFSRRRWRTRSKAITCRLRARSSQLAHTSTLTMPTAPCCAC